MHSSRQVHLLAALALMPAYAAMAQFGERPKPAFELPRPRERSPALPREIAETWWTIRADGTASRLDAPAMPSGDAGLLAAWIDPLPSPSRRESKAPTLALADGQRIVGEVGDADGAVAWISPWCAPRALGGTLDGILSISFDGSEPPAATEQDIVVLRNGDRIDGIVESIGPKMLSIDRSGSPESGSVSVALESVASISLVSPPVAPGGARVWLRDGSVLDGPTLHWMGSDYLQLPGVAGAKTTTLSLPRRMVVALQWTPGTIVPLASLRPAMAAPAGTGGSRVGQPTASSSGRWPLELAPVEVEGPVVLAYQGMTRRSALRAVVTRDATTRAAGSPELIVRQSGKESFRRTLGASDLKVELDVPLEPGGFEIELSRKDGQLAGTFAVLERAMLVPR